MVSFSEVTDLELGEITGGMGMIEKAATTVVTNLPGISVVASRALQNSAQNTGKTADVFSTLVQANNALRSAVNSAFNAVVKAVGGTEIRLINSASVALTGSSVFK